MKMFVHQSLRERKRARFNRFRPQSNCSQQTGLRAIFQISVHANAVFRRHLCQRHADFHVAGSTLNEANRLLKFWGIRIHFKKKFNKLVFQNDASLSSSSSARPKSSRAFQKPAQLRRLPAKFRARSGYKFRSAAKLSRL